MATILNTGVGLSIIVLLDATTGDGNLSSGFGFPVYRAFAPLFIAGSLLMLGSCHYYSILRKM